MRPGKNQCQLLHQRVTAGGVLPANLAVKDPLYRASINSYLVGCKPGVPALRHSAHISPGRHLAAHLNIRNHSRSPTYLVGVYSRCHHAERPHTTAD